MKVVFLENCAQGKKGEVKEVADGFARNFLLPKKFAKNIDATTSNVINQQKQADSFHHERLLKEAYEIKKKLENLEIVQTISFGENGKAFGSITNKEICEFINNKGFNIDKKKIELDQIIKSEGQFNCKIKLYGSVEAKVKIIVVAK